MGAHSIVQLVADIHRGATSAEDVARAALARAAHYDRVQPQVWISRTANEAVIARAREVDRQLIAGASLPLAGVPFAVKDNIDAAGLPTTAACPEFAFLPEVSARTVEQLTDAGAVLIGKTNLDQFATGLMGTRTPHGAPRCVFNREYVSGGSSAGSAVAVAAGIVPLALGSDTAGSGRVPAAFNNLVGFKPTRGRWSTRGLVPACRTLDCVSAFTRTVEDAALVDSLLVEFDDSDPYSRRAPQETVRIDNPPRLGVPPASELEFFGDTDSEELYRDALMRLAAMGALVREIEIAPLLEAAKLLYSGPWVAERTASLEPLLAHRPSAVHPVVRAIVEAGRGISAVETFRAQYVLADYARAAEKIWKGVDALVLPTAPTIYRVSEALAEPVALNSRLGHYTNFVNLLDLAAVALPAGFRRNATGFGVSLIAPAWSDRSLLELAHRLEGALGDSRVPELDLAPRGGTVKLAVVGAHLSGMPLNFQLLARGARLAHVTKTAPAYRLYALADQSPPKPALVHVGSAGSSIAVEVYELELAAFGSFVAEVPAPLAIGTVILADGASVRGFVAEPRALAGAEDITVYGGWRAFMARRDSRSGTSPPSQTASIKAAIP